MRSFRTTGRRLRYRLGLDRNPLRRGSDRIEALILLVLITAFVPLAAVAAGSAAGWVSAAGARAERAGATLTQVHAELLQAAPVVSAPTGTAWLWVRARWTVAGKTHTGLVPATAGMPKGSSESLWVDRDGRVSQPPPTNAQITARVVLAAVAAPGVVALGLWLLWRALRWSLDRRRMVAWARAWASVGPLWSRQR